MKLKNILIVVDNIEESIHFYNELFGLNVISRQEGNVIMSEGLVLQDAGIWQESIPIQTIPYNNRTELYFEILVEIIHFNLFISRAWSHTLQ